MATRRNTVVLDVASIATKWKSHLKEGATLYSSPVFHGYSLWLVPSDSSSYPALTYLKDVISHTAEDLDTSSFSPHLSVLAGMTDQTEEWLVDKMEQLESRLKHNFDDIFVPTLSLHGLGARDLFFQCVYAHPVITKSIIEVNKIACEVFEVSAPVVVVVCRCCCLHEKCSALT